LLREPDKLTLDTNVIQEHWKERPKRHAIEQLVGLAEHGLVDLAVSRYIRVDTPHEPLASRINDLATELRVNGTGGLFTLGVSSLGGTDRLGSEEFDRFQASLAGWRPANGKVPDQRDWDHLHTHFIHRRDAFLTWDRGVLELGKKLADSPFRLVVMSPDAYLASRQ
jgi:hypothetical protein